MGVNNLTIMDNRIRQMLVNDRKENPDKIISLLKSEILYIFKNYMDIKMEDIMLDIGIDNNGKYVINLNVEVGRIFLANCLI